MGRSPPLTAHQMRQRNPERIRDHDQVVETRRGDAGLDSHDRHAVEVGSLGKALLSHPGVLAGLADLDSDRPAALEHLLGNGIGRHLINALGDKIECL